MSQPPERERDRRSLKDLAKLASATSLTPTPPPSKTGSISPLATTRRSDAGDSGVVDLKMMAELDPGAGDRAKDTKLASTALFDEEPESARGPASSKAQATAPSSGRTAASVPPSSGKALAAPKSSPSAADARSSTTASTARDATPASASARAAPKTDEGKTNVLVWVAGVGGLFAAAAAAVIMLQSQPSSSPAANTAAPSPPAVSVTPVAAPKPAPAEPVAAANAPAPDTDQALDPSSLPPAASGARGPVHASSGARAVAPGPQKSVTVAGQPDPAPAAAKPELVAKNIPMSPLGKDSLNDALRQAAGPTDNPSGGGVAAPSTAPQFEPGSVPQKPSSGAITSGVASAMTQARSCLGLDDPISRAAVTFESSGAVQSVVVSGFAAGKPAEACIKGALSKAKVPPFAQPIYTQTFTVRPNS
jgi:hypothetical protein